MGSSSSSKQTSSNADNRVAVQDGIGLSASSGNTISVTTVDAEIVGKALDSVNISSALGAEGFAKLLETSKDMFNTSQGLIGQTQKAVADAYGQAQNDKAGTIDNRTIIVLAVAGAAALVAMNHKG